MSEQRFKRIISVLIGVTTAFTAILAQLESEARSRDDRAGRDARQASLSALGQQVRGSIEANHHYYTAFAHFGEVVTLRELAEARKDEKTAGDLGFQEVNLLSTSPLLDGQDPNGKPYFDYQNKHDGPDLARFEAYTYYINVQKDLQTFKAASKVKDGWSQKANSYVFHLTLLAISLFLFGLGGTIATEATRMIFASAGLVTVAMALGMAGFTYLVSVPDLRQTKGAIEAYANGMGAAYQGQSLEAVAEFDKAIAAASSYADAYLERGNAYQYRESPDRERALADYSKALELDPSNTPIYVEIAYSLFKLGRFEESVKFCGDGLKIQPTNLYLQFQMALSALASGQEKKARDLYKISLESAATAVGTARKDGLEPPSEVFLTIAHASDMLDEWTDALDAKSGQKGDLRKVGQELSNQLLTWQMALEMTGEQPKVGLTAQLTNVHFIDLSDPNKPKEPEQGNVFRGAPKQIGIGYDYKGIKLEQEVTYRTFFNNVEQDSWRMTAIWFENDLERDKVLYTLYPGYTKDFRFEPGLYKVEVFVDYQLAIKETFVVDREKAEVENTTKIQE